MNDHADTSLPTDEERFRKVFDEGPLGILLVGQDGGIQHVNRRFCEMLGYSESEIIALGLAGITHPDDWERDYPLVSRLWHGEIPYCHLEKRYLRKDGQAVWCQLTVSLMHDEAGRPINNIGMVEDITERKRAEEALRKAHDELEGRVKKRTAELAKVNEILAESEAKYRHLVETTDTGYLILDEEGRVVDANAEYVRLAGRENISEIMGRQVGEWTAPHDAKRNAREVQKCLQTGCVRHLEVDYFGPDGKVTPIEINASVIETKQGRRIISLCRDITERKQAAAAIDNRLRFERLLANLSATIVTSGSEQFDEAIDLCLKALVDFLGVEWATVGQFSEDGTYATVTQIYAASGVERFAEKRTILVEELPWYIAQLRAGQMVLIRDIPDGFPASAVEERQYATTQGMKSVAGIPLKVGTSVVGVITFVRLERNCDWQPEIVSRLQLVGEVFANALMRKKSERVLQESEDKYRTLVETSPDGVVLTDLQGNITFVSHGILQLHGSEAVEDFPGKHSLDFIVPEDHQRFLANLQRTLEEGVTRDVEYTFVKKDGTRFAGEVSAAVIRDVTGKPAALTALVRDITERKQAQEAIKESETKLRTLFQILPVGISILDENRRIVDLNPKLEQILGLTKEGLLKGDYRGRQCLRSDGSPLPPEELPSARAMKLGVVVSNVEVGVVKEDSTTVWTLVSAAPLPLDGLGAAVVTRDITELKRAQEAVRQSHDELQAIYDQVSDGIIIVDAEKANPIRANPAFCQILDCDEDEVHTLSPERIHPPEVLPAVWEHLEAVKRGNVARLDHLPCLRKDGGIVYVDVISRPILYNERPCWISSFHDVTERHKAQEALERERQSLWKMLQASDHERQIISYEIHDGLAQYLGGAIMQFQAHDVHQEHSPKKAKKAYETALELVHQAHSESRRLISEVRPPIIDENGLETAISHLVHEHRRHGRPKIECRCSVQFGRLPPILENALYRIAQEALMNACKHSKSKKVMITMSQEGQNIRLEVQDWGIGFDPNAVPAGHFGLEGIRQRVRLLGGRLNIESVADSGTLVQIVVPILERQR